MLHIAEKKLERGWQSHILPYPSIEHLLRLIQDIKKPVGKREKERIKTYRYKRSNED